MRIAWFTPFTKRSAIGRYSMLVTDELSKSCEVDLWLSERGDLLPTRLDIVHYDPSGNLAPGLRDYDFVVYNMGDCLEYHRDVYLASQQVPGIVILHDYVLHHFFTGYHFLYKNNPEGYVKDMRLLYGERGAKAARDSIGHRRVPVFGTDEVIEYPFFEKAISRATGVVVHSRFHRDLVMDKYPGPVKAIPHPFKPQPDYLSGWSRAGLGIPDDRVVLVTIGHVNHNKKIDEVIKVLGSDRGLASRTLYLVVGTYQPGAPHVERLRSMIKDLGLGDTVKLLGYQDDAALAAYRHAADIYINLRQPVMEGASWSVIEEMYDGKPVIVIGSGFYAELPEGAVIKISPSSASMGSEIHKAIKTLAEDRALRESIGSGGRRFIAENFSPRKYCGEFLSFLDEVRSYVPFFGLVDRISAEATAIGVTDDMPLLDKLSKELNAMFGGEGPT